MVIESMSTYLEDEVGPEPTAKPPCTAPFLCISRLNGVVHQVPTALQDDSCSLMTEGQRDQPQGHRNRGMTHVTPFISLGERKSDSV